jgi:leader peptidase (prepilin peptidase)/N-methyltransferase
MFLLFVFIFGLIIGSFLNVVIVRLGQESLGGRSKCPHCRQPLKWFDLFPVISFLVLFGKCRYCRQPINWRYPLVELSTAFLFVINLWLFGPTVAGLINLVIISLLIIITVYDLESLMLPTDLVLMVGGLGLVYSFLNGYFLNALLAGTWWLLLLWLAWRLSRGRSIGVGDSTLMMALGFWLGGQASFTVFVVAVWLGAVIGLALIGASRLFKGGELVTIKSKLPLAPFLSLAALLVLFYDLNLWPLFFGY